MIHEGAHRKTSFQAARTRCPACLVAAVLAWAFLGVWPASAQEARFSGAIEVTSVTLQVTVTRHGKPVTGLVKDDFRVFEDGVERPITSLTRVTAGVSSAPRNLAAARQGPERAASVALRPHIVLLFDVNGASVPVLSRTVKAAEAWVQRHGGGVALWAVAAVGTEPHLLLPYTADTTRVRQAIANITGIHSARDLERMDTSLITDTIRYVPTSLSSDDLGSSNQGSRLSVERLAGLAAWQEGKNQLARLGLLGQGLTEILRGSASLRGPKACLLFSGNIELSTAFTDAFAPSTSRAPFSHPRLGDTVELQRQLQELAQGIAQLSASTGFRIYPIAMGGLRSASRSIDVTNAGRSDLRDETSGPASLNPRSSQAAWDALPLTLAEVTGGRYIRRNQVASSLQEAYSTLSTYYLLGFQSRRKASGVWRKLRVTVRKPGVRVEYRRGRYDLDREQTLAEQLTAPRLLSVPSGDLPLTLRAIVQEKNGQKRVTATVTTRLERLTFVPNGSTWVARLGLLAATYDDPGRFLRLHRGRQTVKVPAALWDGVKSKKARFALSFALPPGATQVTMAIFDEESQTWGLASAPITPGKPQQPGLVNAVPGGVPLPVLRRLPSPALVHRSGRGPAPGGGKQPAVSPAPGAPPCPLVSWAKGPVRWLMTRDERSQTSRSCSPSEAARWIRLFWARRDPNPKTAANPFRKVFEERVRMADALLTEPGLRGSLTDRGHVLVLLGRPKSRRKSADLTVDTWFYRRKDLGTIATRVKLPPVVRFQFRLDRTGHFQLHDEVASKQRQAEGVLRWYPATTIVNPHLTVAPVPPLYVGVPAASSGELDRIVSAPETWPAGALATTYPEAFPGQALRTWIVVELPDMLPQPTSVTGLVLDRERMAAGSFRMPLAPRLREGVWSLDLSLPVPDRRSSLILAISSGGELIAVKRLSLRIPVAPPGTTVITPAIFGTDLGRIERFHPWTTNIFGGYHLEPQPAGRFHLGDTVYFFFNVLGVEPAAGSPPAVDVQLRLLRADAPVAAARWDDAPLSMMSAGTYLFGSSFSLAALDRPGWYTLELTVRQRSSGAVEITTFPISVLE